MRKLRLLVAALSILSGVSAWAQTDIAGTWTGMLAAAPGATLEVHFVLTRAGDGYTAVLKSPTPGAIPETPATSVSFADNRLVLTYLPDTPSAESDAVDADAAETEDEEVAA